MESLFLVGNNFAGTINSNIADLTKLTRLQLNGNQFVGSFPSISASTNLGKEKFLFIQSPLLPGKMLILFLILSVSFLIRRSFISA
jgi:hypothetical protein